MKNPVQAVVIGGGAALAIAAADPADYMPARLIAETLGPRPGSATLVGFRMTPRSGWHGYWSNPGDAGIVPTVKWSAPDGVRFGPLLHPAPKLISADGMNSYVHEGRHVLLSRMTVSPDVAKGTRLPVRAELSWAACTATQCVPLRATFGIDLVAGEGGRGPEAGELRAALAKVPRTVAGGGFQMTGKQLALALPKSPALDWRRTRFFADANGIVASGGGRAVQGSQGPQLLLEAIGPVGDRLVGVVSDGRTAYRVALPRRDGPPATADPAPPTEQPSASAAAPSSPDARPAAGGDLPGAPAKRAGGPAEKPFPWIALLLLPVLAAAVFWTVRRRRR